LVLSASPAVAQTWTGNGATNNWSDPNNWNPTGIPPSATATALTFAGGTRLSPVNDIATPPPPFVLNALAFAANASSFSLSGNALQLAANGGTLPTLTVTSPSPVVQTINNSIVLANNLAVTYNGAPNGTAPTAGALILNGGISGSGSLTMTGILDVTLNAANSYTGGTVLNTTIKPDGRFPILTAAVTNALPPGGDVTIKAQELLINRLTTQTVGNLTLSDPTFPPPPNLPEARLDFTGATLKLNGTFAFTPPPSVTAAAVTFVFGGTLDLGTTVHAFNVTTGGEMRWQASVVGAGGGMNKTGPGTLTLEQTGATYTGPTTISGGALQVDITNALPTATAVTLQTGGTLVLTPYSAGQQQPSRDQTIGSLTGDSSTFVYLNNNTLTVGDSNSTTFSGVIKDNPVATAGGKLVKTGSGTLTLAGSNGYTGGTTIQQGTLQLGVANALPPNGPVILAGGTLDLNGFKASVGPISGTSGSISLGSGALTVNSGTDSTLGVNITGTGSLTKTGAGTLILTGTSTYSGGTTVSGGTLRVNGSIAGPVTLTAGSGAKLGGSGTVGPGSVGPTNGLIISNGCSVDPGNSPGVLTVNAPATFSSGSSFIAELNGPTPGNGANYHDQLVVTGAGNTVALNGATLSAALGYTPGANDKLFILDNETGTPIQGTFAQGSTIVVNGYAAQISYLGNPVALTTTGGSSVVLFGFTPVPEPTSILLVCAAGAAGAAWVRRRGGW
jgi:autotransporter-associated beta strand protein